MSKKLVVTIIRAVCCIQDTLSSRAALGLPAAVQPLGRVRRASKGILHTKRCAENRNTNFANIGKILKFRNTT